MNEINKLINIWIHFRFQVIEFENLYPKDSEIENLRMKTVPDFFWNINELYWNTFLITIARLLDKHEQGQNQNLTLYSLPAILEIKEISEHTMIKERIDNLSEKFKTVRLYRKKFLAHFDKDYTIGKKSFNSITNIEEVHYFLKEMLSLIDDTQGLLSLEKFSGLVMYPARYSGAKELIRILQKDLINRKL
jgi:hypothetical protein